MSTNTNTRSSESWVTEQLGITVTVTPTSPEAEAYADSIELGLRRNNKRAQLLVSTILGKHVPVPGKRALDAGRLLGRQVRELVGDQEIVVVGFAETATALGHAVAAGADARTYLHTTRAKVPADAHRVDFLEEHSHATEQALAVHDLAVLDPEAVLVLVDDEISTGNTALNAIKALQAAWPRRQYVIASLLDSRTPAEHTQIAAGAAAVGAAVQSTSILTGHVELPENVIGDATNLRAGLPETAEPAVESPTGDGTVTGWRIRLAGRTPTSGAHGWTKTDEESYRDAARQVAAQLGTRGRTLVLGDEEHMYLAQLIAEALGETAKTSSTTRSPVVVVDTPGYPVRSALTYKATTDPERLTYAYNVPADRDGTAHDRIVVVLDGIEKEQGSTSLVKALTGATREVVVITTLPGNGSATTLTPSTLGVEIPTQEGPRC